MGVIRLTRSVNVHKALGYGVIEPKIFREIMKIAVVDGQGGGIGANLISRLREKLPEEVEIIALGTNAVATSNMMKAKANRGASGENAIIRTVPTVDIITGPVGIILANSMMGELTPPMSEAISSSSALKVLLPINICNVEIVGVEKEPLPHLIEKLVDRIKEICYIEQSGEENV